MNDENLIPLTMRSQREQQEIRRKGQAAATKTKRERKTIAKLVSEMMNREIDINNLPPDMQELADIVGEEKTMSAYMVAGQARSAIQGNTRAFEKLTEIVDKEASRENRPWYIPARDIGCAFVDLNRSIDDREYAEYWLRGGRGSIKSTYISEKIEELLKNNPKMCALVVRKVTNTIKDSVFSQIKWAIDHSGLSDEFKYISSPYEITLKQTGQKIYFRGADDPGKIKSIKPPEGMYIGIVWYEEADQMDGMEAIRNINQSAIRGGDDALVFISYNTPRSNMHWINRESLIPKEKRFLHTSTYLQAPKKWLGKAFIDEAEWLKDAKPDAYKHEYLGIAVGNGSEVFDNLTIREITQEEREQFDHIHRGVDWGWSPDPFHYGAMHYDANRKKLYIFEEFRVNKMSNEQTAKILQEEYGVRSTDLIICDSAEQKSVADYRAYGLCARPAEKGPDSVRYSIKWLQSLVEIVIDPVSCPHTAREFTQLQYALDKEGNVTSEIPDKDNHSVDMVRYAMNDEWKRKGR